MGCVICDANMPDEFLVVPYEGDCKHGRQESGYGFRASWRCRGIGMYAWCECGAMSYFPDHESCSEDELEWFRNSPWNKGWVITPPHKDCDLEAR